MYEEQLGEGDDYSKIERTVCINILNFKYLKTNKFHTGYRLKEMETHEELTDVIEMHFIEIPKLEEKGERKKAIEIAKNLLDILDNKTIALKTGLTIVDIELLRI